MVQDIAEARGLLLSLSVWLFFYGWPGQVGTGKETRSTTRQKRLHLPIISHWVSPRFESISGKQTASISEI